MVGRADHRSHRHGHLGRAARADQRQHVASDLRRNAGAVLLVDALEVAPVDGTPVAAKPCPSPTQVAACAPMRVPVRPLPAGVCRLGPDGRAAGHRAEFVDRWIGHRPEHSWCAQRRRRMAVAMGGGTTRAAPPDTVGRQPVLHRDDAARQRPAKPPHELWRDGKSGALAASRGGHKLHDARSLRRLGELDLLEDDGSGGSAHHLQGGGLLACGRDARGRAMRSPPSTAWTRCSGFAAVYLTWATGVPADPGADLAWSATSVAWMIAHTRRRCRSLAALSHQLHRTRPEGDRGRHRGPGLRESCRAPACSASE